MKGPPPIPDIDTFTIEHRGGLYRILNLDLGNHQLQISISPTGKSVQVFLNNDKLT